MLLECLHTILTDSRVDEIVIVDDCSTDLSATVDILDKLNDVLILSNIGEKIKIKVNKENKRGFYNKIEAVAAAKNDWVILLDSDNYLYHSYINALYALPSWEKDIVYCPEFALPNFNYSLFISNTIDAEYTKRMLEGKAEKTQDQFRLLLNTGNFFFNRNEYLRILGLEQENLIEPYGVCSFYFNYLWMKNGNKMRIVKDASYFHRIHDDSYWIQNDRISIKMTEQFTDSIKNGFSKLIQL